MKKLIFTCIFFVSIHISYSQIIYDDGPIVLGNNFVIGGSWGRNNITFSFQNGTDDIAGNDEENAIRQAFQIWSDYANINFTEVAQNGDIRILWAVRDHGDGIPFDGPSPPSRVLAHAFLPDPNITDALAGDVHFDDDETWTMNERPPFSWQPYDLVTVAAHEIGHALGLAHSNVTCALMNAVYNGSHRYLSQDDIDGIQSIYGNRTVVRTINLNCSGGTFFINHLPNGANVFWTSSNNSIATVANNNNQGIVSIVGSASGNVRITGTITLPCGTTVVEFMDIHIGIQTPTNIVGLNPPLGVSPGELLELEADDLGLQSYNWWVEGGTIRGLSNSSNVTIEVDRCYGQYNGWLNVHLSYQNACGTSEAYTEYTTIDCGTGGGGGPLFAMSPNPARDNLTVDGRKKGKSIKEIYIVDKFGNIKRKTKYLGDSKFVNFNISGLPADIYYIKIFDGQKWESKQLRVQ